jgi:hypothetical protein
MTFEVLKWTPISGEFEEKHFGKTDVHPLWIKFYSISSYCWIGSFASGDIGLENEKIIDINNTSETAVLTKGKFYVINNDSKELIMETEGGYYTDFEIVVENNLIVLATYWGISIFKNYKLIKEINPEFIDGVRFTKRTGDLLKGEIYEPGDDWYEFELNLQSLKLKWLNFEY